MKVAVGVALLAAAAWLRSWALRRTSKRDAENGAWGTVGIVHPDGSTTELGRVLDQPDPRDVSREIEFPGEDTERDAGWPPWMRHGPTRRISFTADLNERALRELQWEMMEEAGELPPEGTAERAILRHRVLYGHLRTRDGATGSRD